MSKKEQQRAANYHLLSMGYESLHLRHRFWTAQKSLRIRRFENRRLLRVEHCSGALSTTRVPRFS